MCLYDFYGIFDGDFVGGLYNGKIIYLAYRDLLYTLYGDFDGRVSRSIWPMGLSS